MLEAFALGLAAQSSLLASGLLASWVKVPTRVVGWLAAFGAGALVSALTFNLTLQASVLGSSLSLAAGWRASGRSSDSRCRLRSCKSPSRDLSRTEARRRQPIMAR